MQYYNTVASALPVYQKIIGLAKAQKMSCVENSEIPDYLPAARQRRELLQRIQSEAQQPAFRQMCLRFIIYASKLP